MFHQRKWTVTNAQNQTEVVEALSTSQNSNFGIRFADFLFLNDSTDSGVREFAVVDEQKSVQVDSWTVDWMAKREIDSSIRESMLNREGLAAFSTPYEFDNEMVTDIPVVKYCSQLA